MRCPYCFEDNDKVIDSRLAQEGRVIRRRRECSHCSRRYTTYEHIEEIPLMVIKKDSRREPFDRMKIKNGLVKSCEKRPISMEEIEKIIDDIEIFLTNKLEKEVKSEAVGEEIMNRLKSLDEVAYVRFASVYRQFKDVTEFTQAVEGLKSPKEG